MERKIVLYIACSLDGYIARKDGSLDWLDEFGDIDMGYDKFYSSVDTVVMGRTIYDQINTELSPDKWAYEGKECYVATTKEHESDKNVEFISKDITGVIKDLKKKEGKDIWLGWWRQDNRTILKS